tara:strand:+ start:1005 stop:2768 length:1764 start_codon:yes stop_codon:yes gene_type:complete
MEKITTLSDEQNDFCINYLKAILTDQVQPITELTTLQKLALVTMIKAQPSLQEELISPLSNVLTQTILTLLKQPDNPQEYAPIESHTPSSNTDSLTGHSNEAPPLAHPLDNHHDHGIDTSSSDFSSPNETQSSESSESGPSTSPSKVKPSPTITSLPSIDPLADTLSNTVTHSETDTDISLESSPLQHPRQPPKDMPLQTPQTVDSLSNDPITNPSAPISSSVDFQTDKPPIVEPAPDITPLDSINPLEHPASTTSTISKTLKKEAPIIDSQDNSNTVSPKTPQSVDSLSSDPITNPSAPISSSVDLQTDKPPIVEPAPDITPLDPINPLEHPASTTSTMSKTLEKEAPIIDSQDNSNTMPPKTPQSVDSLSNDPIHSHLEPSSSSVDHLTHADPPTIETPSVTTTQPTDSPVSPLPDIHQVQTMIRLLIEDSYKSPKMLKDYIKTVVPVLSATEFDQLCLFLIESYNDFSISLLNKDDVITTVKFYITLNYFMPLSNQKAMIIVPLLDQFLLELCQFSRPEDQYKLLNYFPPMIIQLALKRLSMYRQLSSHKLRHAYHRFYTQLNHDSPQLNYPKISEILAKINSF